MQTLLKLLKRFCYHKPMRRFIFILMIALLPLRGWMGEAMATEMATTKFTTVASHVKNMADAASSVALTGCDTHIDSAFDQNSPTESCTHCQACHAAALIETVQTADLHPRINLMPHDFVTQLSSADRQLSQKPPIL